jgi:hypothetical protein
LCRFGAAANVQGVTVLKAESLAKLRQQVIAALDCYR